MTLLPAVISWARRRSDVRAALLVGSRAEAQTSGSAADSDFLLVVDQPDELRDTAWVSGLSPPLICFWEVAAGGNLKCSALFADMGSADFVILPRSAGPEGVARWLTPPHGGQITPVSVVYDEFDLADRLAPLLRRAPDPLPALDEEKYRYLVKRFWFVTFGVALRLQRGEIWYAHDLWSRYLLNILTRLLAWTYWDRAHAADPFMKGRRMESWVPAAAVGRLHEALALGTPNDMLATLSRTAVAFEATAHACASRYGFRYPVCPHGAVLKHIERAVAGPQRAQG